MAISAPPVQAPLPTQQIQTMLSKLVKANAQGTATPEQLASFVKMHQIFNSFKTFLISTSRQPISQQEGGKKTLASKDTQPLDIRTEAGQATPPAPAKKTKSTTPSVPTSQVSSSATNTPVKTQKPPKPSPSPVVKIDVPPPSGSSTASTEGA